MDDLDVGEAGRPFDQGMDERLGLGGARMDVDPPARADAVHGILRRRQARAVQSSPAVHGVLLKRIPARRASRFRSATLDASPLPASAPTIADSGRARVRSRYAPSATRFATLTEPAFPAIAVAGRPIASTLDRSGGSGIRPESKITSPPSATSGRKRSKDGRLKANSTEARLTSGESTGDRDRMTWQCAVPPRISCP